MLLRKWLTVFRGPRTFDEAFDFAVALAAEASITRIVVDRPVRYPGIGLLDRSGVAGLVHAYHDEATPLPSALSSRAAELGCDLYGMTESRRTFTDASRGSAAEERDGIWRMGLLRRSEDRSQEEFTEHWREVHSTMVERHHPGTAQLRQNAVERVLLPGSAELSGIFEAYNASYLDVRDRTFDSEAGKAEVFADLATFTDQSKTELLFVHRTRIR